MKKLYIKPMQTKMVVVRDKFTYKGALEIPKTAQSRPTKGTIIAVGSDVTLYKVGDKVIFAHLSGVLMRAHHPGHHRADDSGMIEWVILDQSEIHALLTEVPGHPEAAMETDEGAELKMLYGKD